MPLGPLAELPREAWMAFGVAATVFTTFILGLVRIKVNRGTSKDEAYHLARAELSSSQRDFIKALQDEMSLHHAKMADMDTAYLNIRKELREERESCDRKLEELHQEIKDLKGRMASEEAR